MAHRLRITSHPCWQAIVLPAVLCMAALCMAGSTTHETLAQDNRRLPKRATPPSWSPDSFQGVFFTDLAKQLQGDRPQANARTSQVATTPNLPSSNKDSTTIDGSAQGLSLEQVWKQRMQADSLELLVKSSKLRLDSAAPTPAKFAGGGYREARREFHLLSVLFGIIEQHPDPVRWKASAPSARERFAQAASTIRTGTNEHYNLARERLEDLATMMKGGKLSESKAPAPLDWTAVADREPLMQLMEWGLREKMTPYVSSAESIRKNQEELTAYASLMDGLGELLQQPGMPDSEDTMYIGFAREMSQHAQGMLSAMKLENPDAVRDSLARLDQSCTRCHGEYK